MNVALCFRVGGKDNFFHCHNCGLCIAVASRESHTCRAGMSKDNCPVCMEVRLCLYVLNLHDYSGVIGCLATCVRVLLQDIHSSRNPAHIPPCGHLLHM